MAVADATNPVTPIVDSALVPAIGNALAKDIEAVTGQLSGSQMRYIANLVTSGSVGEAAKRTGVKDGTVRSWRARVPGFQVAERIAKEQGGSLSRQIALALGNSYVGEAMGRLIEEMNHAPQSRDRIRAAIEILDRVGVTGQKATPGVTVSMPPGVHQYEMAMRWQKTGKVHGPTDGNPGDNSN